ncbi:unnamed protein product, partial [Iphiclides podalirius]
MAYSTTISYSWPFFSFLLDGRFPHSFFSLSSKTPPPPLGPRAAVAAASSLCAIKAEAAIMAGRKCAPRKNAPL